MRTTKKAKILRLHFGESDRYQGKPLYEEIVLLAKKFPMAGATVVKGVMGFGCKSHMHTAKILRLSEDLPMIIEIVDSEEKISRFLPQLDKMVGDGLITLEKANVVMYRASGKI